MNPFFKLILWTVLIICGLRPSNVQAFKAPVRPIDVLPLLPRQISWPLLNKLNSAVDLLPSFVGAASATNNSLLQWKGACFYDNTAWLVFHNNSGTQWGGGTIHIKVIYFSISLFSSWDLLGSGQFGTEFSCIDLVPLVLSLRCGLIVFNLLFKIINCYLPK